MLNWKSTNYDQSKFFHKGTELAVALCGGYSRFQICETRIMTNDTEYPYDLDYRVRDAATVSDAEVREGKRPEVVASFSDLDEAIAFCMERDPVWVDA